MKAMEKAFSDDRNQPVLSIAILSQTDFSLILNLHKYLRLSWKIKQVTPNFSLPPPLERDTYYSLNERGLVLQIFF